MLESLNFFAQDLWMKVQDLGEDLLTGKVLIVLFLIWLFIELVRFFGALWDAHVPPEVANSIRAFRRIYTHYFLAGVITGMFCWVFDPLKEGHVILSLVALVVAIIALGTWRLSMAKERATNKSEVSDA